MPDNIVIIGANLAGGRAAEALRAEGYDGRLTLVGEEPHRPYERPPLSKEILRGEWEPDKAFLRPAEYYAENDIELLLGSRATTLDADAVALADGTRVEHDVLLLCTGGRPRTLPIPGADLDGVFTLRTIDDSLAILGSFQPGEPIVVIGAGFIGAEVAASAKTFGCEVTLLEALPVPMERALGRELGEVYAAIHRDNGVDLRTGVEVERIEGDKELERVALADGTTFDARAVVIGVGIEPNVELARDAGIDCDNGILVDERCATSMPGVFAAGDVANHPNPILGERIRVEHWQNAQNQAAAAAKAMLGQEAPFAEVPWFWSDQYDVNLQMAGHPTRWDRIVYRGDVDARAFAAFYLDGERLVAALGVNKAKEVRGARALIEAGVQLSDDELADDDVDLRKRARAAT